MSAAACTITATVIGCQSLMHCVGCDQCEPTTAPRRCTPRDGGAAAILRLCDECTLMVNSGTSDVLTSATNLPMSLH